LLSPKVAAGAFVEELDDVFQLQLFSLLLLEDSSVRCNYSLNSLLNSITLKSADSPFFQFHLLLFKVTSMKATISSPNSTVAPLSTISEISPLWIVPTANESSY
jgi:hypothetical protein